MVDMSGTPQIPTIKSAFRIMQDICTFDPDAPKAIAAHRLRLANENRIDENRNINGPYIDRMAFFLAGAANIPALESIFISSAFWKRK